MSTNMKIVPFRVFPSAPTFNSVPQFNPKPLTWKLPFLLQRGSPLLHVVFSCASLSTLYTSCWVCGWVGRVFNQRSFQAFKLVHPARGLMSKQYLCWLLLYYSFKSQFLLSLFCFICRMSDIGLVTFGRSSDPPPLPIKK